MNVHRMVEVTWGTAVAALQANQIDTMFILTRRPNALAIDFVNNPILWYPVAALARTISRPPPGRN